MAISDTLRPSVSQRITRHSCMTIKLTKQRLKRTETETIPPSTASIVISPAVGAEGAIDDLGVVVRTDLDLGLLVLNRTWDTVRLRPETLLLSNLEYVVHRLRRQVRSHLRQNDYS